jgi:hypothetical protein
MLTACTWGNIGSFLAGLSTVAIAVAALVRGPAALRDWRARERAQADAAHEEAETVRLERRRGLEGWSRSGVNTYEVSLVTSDAEFEQAVRGLKANQPANYVVLRISTGRGQFNDVGRAESLRRLVEIDGQISRSPSAGELEALEAGLDKMGIARAPYGRVMRSDETPGTSASA